MERLVHSFITTIFTFHEESFKKCFHSSVFLVVIKIKDFFLAEQTAKVSLANPSPVKIQ